MTKGKRAFLLTMISKNRSSAEAHEGHAGHAYLSDTHTRVQHTMSAQTSERTISDFTPPCHCFRVRTVYADFSFCETGQPTSLPLLSFRQNGITKYSRMEETASFCSCFASMLANAQSSSIPLSNSCCSRFHGFLSWRTSGWGLLLDLSRSFRVLRQKRGNKKEKGKRGYRMWWKEWRLLSVILLNLLSIRFHVYDLNDSPFLFMLALVS